MRQSIFSPLVVIVLVTFYSGLQCIRGNEETTAVGEVPLKTLYVCDSPGASLLGMYKASAETALDGVHTFTNEHGKSFFRNKGFWYLGDLEPWPPITYYRCVEPEGCNYGLDNPPTSEEGEWSGNKKQNTDGPTLIQSEPCPEADFISEEL